MKMICPSHLLLDLFQKLAVGKYPPHPVTAVEILA